MKTLIRNSPFDQLGNLMHYARPGVWPEAALWREVGPWGDSEMILEEHITSGRSAKYVHVRSMDGVTYPMFVADLMKIAHARTIHRGKIFVGMGDRWYIAKRGQNYGLSLLLNGET